MKTLFGILVGLFVCASVQAQAPFRRNSYTTNLTFTATNVVQSADTIAVTTDGGSNLFNVAVAGIRGDSPDFVPILPTVLVFEGDSITAGHPNPSYPYSYYATNLYFTNTQWVYGTNAAVNGALIAGVQADYVSQIQRYKPVPGTNSILCINIGYNDIGSGTNAANAFAALSNYWSTAKADGFKICAFTITGYLGAGEIGLFNKKIRASSFWDYLVDVESMLPILDIPLSSIDGFHWSTNTSRMVGKRVYQTLTSGLGIANGSSAYSGIFDARFTYDNATASSAYSSNNFKAGITWFGYAALSQNTGNYSSGFGSGSLQQNTGAFSSGFGSSSLFQNTGVNSSGFGYAALYQNSGNLSSGFGASALYQNTGGFSSGFGSSSLYRNTGDNSCGFGYVSLYLNTGPYSSGFGASALYQNTGGYSSGFGYSSLTGNSGIYSSGFGYNSLSSNSGGSSSGFGFSALSANTGANSSGFGFQSLLQNKGANASGFGYLAGAYNKAAGQTTFGYQSGLHATNAANSVFIGPNSGPATDTNGFGSTLWIANATGTPLIFGDFTAKRMSVDGYTTAQNGAASYTNNLVAPATITIGASPVLWTNTTPVNAVAYVDGVSVTGTVALNGGIIFNTIGQNTILMQPNEVLTITFTIGTPTAKWKPF